MYVVLSASILAVLGVSMVDQYLFHFISPWITLECTQQHWTIVEEGRKPTWFLTFPHGHKEASEKADMAIPCYSITVF